MKPPSLAASLLLPSAASAAVFPDVPLPDESSVARGIVSAPRFDVDCVDITFHPQDPPVSSPVTLKSRKWVADCAPFGASGENCWELPGLSETMDVRLTLANRQPLLPWENDAFRACLTGLSLNVQAVSTAYNYTVVNDGALDGNVTLVSGLKRALPPDPLGVQAELTPGMTLVFHDRWAAYYPGERITLKIALKKEEGRFWPDETVVQKEVTLPVAESYSVPLECASCRPGEAYYADYSIRRLGGQVSTEDETPVLRTEAAAYAP